MVAFRQQGRSRKRIIPEHLSPFIQTFIATQKAIISPSAEQQQKQQQKAKKKKKKKKKNGKQTPPLALFLHLQALTGHCLLAVPTSCEHAMSKSPQEGSPQLSRKSGGSVKKSRGRGAKAIWQKLCSDPTSSLTCSSSCIGLLPFRCHHLLLNPLWAPSALALLLFHLVQVFFFFAHLMCLSFRSLFRAFDFFLIFLIF